MYSFSIIIVYGGNGWIGKQFCQHLENNNYKYIVSKNRADDEDAVDKELQELRPTHVISLIGRTHGPGNNTVDYLEEKDKLPENIRDNLFAPMVLALLCKKYNIHLTYIGTGCIFSNENPLSIAYNENDKPNFFGSSYSIVKGYTDRLMHLFDNVLNLRIRMPIINQEHHRNFITKLTQYRQICSIPNSMTVLEDMYPVIIDMMKKKQKGTFNLCNSGMITHNEILTMYKEIIDPTITWQEFSKDEECLLKAKRSNTQLCTNKLYELYPDIPDIHTSVKNCLMSYIPSCKSQKNGTDVLSS